jgi:hypothetical protein
MWPEAFLQIRDLPAGAKTVFVRIQCNGPAIDNIRLAAIAHAGPPAGTLEVTHRWSEQGKPREYRERVDADTREHRYRVSAGEAIANQSVSFELLR